MRPSLDRLVRRFNEEYIAACAQTFVEIFQSKKLISKKKKKFRDTLNITVSKKFGHDPFHVSRSLAIALQNGYGPRWA